MPEFPAAALRLLADIGFPAFRSADALSVLEIMASHDSYFARYEEQGRGGERTAPLAGFGVRRGAPADRDALAALVFEREGGTLEAHREGAARELSAERSDNLLLVAEVGQRLIGFARARYFTHPEQPAPRLAPAGWYLAGVIVAPAYRRRGVAAELTRRRLDWIARRATEAFYFANARNRVSIALHERFGFVEVTRDFIFPGVAFAGGAGILFRLDLSQRPADPAPRVAGADAR